MYLVTVLLGGAIPFPFVHVGEANVTVVSVGLTHTVAVAVWFELTVSGVVA